MTEPGDLPPEQPTAEGTGETVGEAKWAALRELERLHPVLDKGAVRFQVLSEGERGLLGVGFTPARVIATLPGGARPSQTQPLPAEEPGSPAALLRALLEHVSAALGLRASVAVTETAAGLEGRLAGGDLGLAIGRRGQTIDAIQYLANAILWAGEGERRAAVVDAAGYRARRQTALERAADRAAREALDTRSPIGMEPMSAAERKVVHLYLQSRGDVVTGSEGAEPERYVVVAPAE